MSAASTSPLRALLSLAWPIILARATQSVVGFCDALMVAPLGEASLAAVTTGALNTFAFIILPFGTVFILQSFTAQLRGRGQLDAVGRYAHYGLILAAVAALLGLCSLPLIESLFPLLGYEPQVEELLVQYMVIRILSIGGAVGAEALGNWYGGLGNTRISMIVGVVTMVANVVGNYLLIEPRFGLPGFGVAGAAWASVIASWLGFAVAFVAFARGRGYGAEVRYDSGVWRSLRISELRRVLRFGLPNGVNWFLEFSAFFLFVNLVVTSLGTTALAAFNVMIQINSISFMPAFGLASGGAVLVGEAIGRGAHDEVSRFVRLTAAVAAAWMLSVGSVYLLIPEQLVGLFAPGSPAQAAELLGIGVTMLMLSAVWQLFDAFGLTLSEALRAAGDTTWCMWARVTLAWGVFLPCAWLGVRVYPGGVPALMASLAAYIGLLATALVLRFRAGRWRSIDLVGVEPVLVPGASG